MESFFLAETTKYLYLLFDEDNFIHHDDGTADLHQAAHGECALPAGNFIFNTEAHPFDLGGVQCCATEKKNADKYAADMHASIDIPFLFGLTKDRDTFESGEPWYRDQNRENMASNHEADASAANVSSPSSDDCWLECSMYDYCQCDIPLVDFSKVCLKNWQDVFYMFTICPARFCRRASSENATFAADDASNVHFGSNLTFPVGSPEMLTCSVDDEYDLVLYGEINHRR